VCLGSNPEKQTEDRGVECTGPSMKTGRSWVTTDPEGAPIAPTRQDACQHQRRPPPEQAWMKRAQTVARSRLTRMPLVNVPVSIDQYDAAAAGSVDGPLLRRAILRAAQQRKNPSTGSTAESRTCRRVPRRRSAPQDAYSFQDPEWSRASEAMDDREPRPGILARSRIAPTSSRQELSPGADR
jgi:hypothetical protein